jgi:hypothetical protein
MIEECFLLPLGGFAMRGRPRWSGFCFFLVSFFLAFCGHATAGADPGESKGEIAPRLFSLQKKAYSLTAAIQKLSQQTGIEIVDKRLVKTDPQLELQFEKTPFWQALDAIARKARVVVNVYQGDGRIALVDGTYRELPVSYSGVFRTVVKSLVLMQNFDTGTKNGVAHLEVAWEPRFEPLYLEQKPASVCYAKGKGQATFQQGGRSPVAVHGRSYLDFKVEFPAPDRSTLKVDLIKGSLSLLTPSKMLTFTFENLTPGEKKTQEGITVRLNKFNWEDDPWDLGIVLDYPGAGGIKFESYQSWLVNNQIYLENKRSKRIKHFAVGERAQRATYPHAELVYFFGNKKGKLGKPRDLKLVYRTPGKIVTIPMQFEFKDLKLP